MSPPADDAESAVERLLSDPEWERHRAESGTAAETRWADWSAAVDPLVERLVGGDERTRERAATALGWVGDDAAVDPLVGRLRADESAAVREAAAVALGAVGDAGAVDALGEAFETEPVATVRPRIAAALADCGGVAAAVEIVETYRGPDREPVVREAVGALASGDAAGREAAVELLLTSDPLCRRVAAGRLPGDEDDARTALTTALRDDDGAVRAAAARSLADYVATLGSPSLGERLLHRVAGDRVPSDPVLADLVAVLDRPDPDPDEDVRLAAVETLAEATGRPGVDRVLRSAADAETTAVREAARAALDDDRDRKSERR